VLDAKKKSLSASERDAVARRNWQILMTIIAAGRLVVVDEVGFNLALTPLYARAPQGQRAYDAVRRHAGKNLSLIPTLTVQRIAPSMTIERAVDSAVFRVYVEEVLAPSLRPGQIVVLDNLSVHKQDEVRELVEARRCEVWFLPAYSPDMSPIELAFSKIKAYLRRVGARTHERLEAAIAGAVDLITPADARAFFQHCGYQLAVQPL